MSDQVVTSTVHPSVVRAQALDGSVPRPSCAFGTAQIFMAELKLSVNWNAVNAFNLAIQNRCGCTSNAGAPQSEVAVPRLRQGAYLAVARYRKFYKNKKM